MKHSIVQYLIQQYAKGEYIKFLCADDKFHPKLLDKFVPVMDTNTGVSLITTQNERFGSQNRLRKPPVSGLVNGHAIWKEVVKEPDFDRRAVLISQIEDLEHVNDDLTHKIFTELGRNFITPFDREDVHHLATALDDIADYIYASAKKINF